jgi:very-short-patch-repair endonuclease
MTEYFNRSSEKEMRRRLRKEMPQAEVVLWTRLRGKQLFGKKFRRQYSVGPYSIDFYCPEVKLAIELDGDSHFTQEAKQYDAQRQQYIESFGIRFLRFTNQDVYENLDGVLEAISLAVQENPPQSPLFKGGSEEVERAEG